MSWPHVVATVIQFRQEKAMEALRGTFRGSGRSDGERGTSSAPGPGLPYIAMTNRDFQWRSCSILSRQLLNQDFFYGVREEHEIMWARRDVQKSTLGARGDGKEAWWEQKSLATCSSPAQCHCAQFQQWCTVQPAEGALQLWQLMWVDLRSFISHKIDNYAIHMYRYTQCFPQISLQPLLTRWCISRWLVHEARVTSVSLKSCSSTSSLLWIMEI